MLYVPLAGLSGKALNHIKRIASFKNPEFYAKQGMRLSTYNIPHIISCADLSFAWAQSFGTLDSNGNRLHGVIDIALILGYNA